VVDFEMNTGCGWSARRGKSRQQPGLRLRLRWTLLGEEMQPFQLRRTVSCAIPMTLAYRQLVRADPRRRINEQPQQDCD
jgi:hypothetical protein